MNGALLQQKLVNGRARAASQIGTSHNQYRGTPTNPLAPASLIGSVQASFNINGAYKGQSSADQLYWQVINSGTIQIGDYLVGTHTWCIVAIDQLLPPIALRCTDSLTFSRPAAAAQVGALSYQTVAAQAIYATSVPGYLSAKKETGRPATALPGDADLRAFYSAAFYLPAGSVEERDIVTDGNGARYQVVAATAGLLGYNALLERMQA